MVRVHAGLVVAFVLSGVVGACAEASSDTVSGGGPRFDPTPEAPPAQPSNPAADAGSGTTFTDLYRDFFGPQAPASCSGPGLTACHGAKDHSGGNIFVCAADKAECRTGIAGLAAGATFKDSLLFDILRKNPAFGSNRMPKAPKTYTFEQPAIDRIGAWVAAGAKDD